MLREQCRFAVISITVLSIFFLFAPSAFAELSVSYGLVITADSDAYGEKVYEVADDSGDATDKWGLSDADAFSSFGLAYLRTGERGTALDVATRTPYYVDVEHDAFGAAQPSWEYKRLVWPAASFSMRKHFGHRKHASPYLGAGMGVYYVETDLDSDGLEDFHQNKFLPSLNYFGGLMFDEHFFIELRRETTRMASATKDRGLATGYPYDFDDDGDLGGIMLRLGGVW